MVAWTSRNKLVFVITALRQFAFQKPRLDCSVPAEGGNCFLVQKVRCKFIVLKVFILNFEVSIF